VAHRTCRWANEIQSAAAHSLSSNGPALGVQAIATGSSADAKGGGGSYPLFKLGAACWYFGQRLSELGVGVPIGLADTAIGGQRIEEYMNNATIGKCNNR